MEQIDPVFNRDDASEEELLMKEVFQEDSDLYFLHHYLSDLLRPRS